MTRGVALLLLGAVVALPATHTSAIAQVNGKAFDQTASQSAAKMLTDGKKIFRYDTFGSEAFWGGRLKLHEAIEGEKNGGVGAGISPKQALELGLKVDMDVVPKNVATAIKQGKVDLDDPANTLFLLKANAVVGVTGFFTRDGNGSAPSASNARCAIPTVDDAFAPGIGHRLDGWPNRDLNVGAIIAAPDSQAVCRRCSASTRRPCARCWAAGGPGKFDAELILDGKAFRPDGKPAATLIPPAFGLAGVNLHTWTGLGLGHLLERLRRESRDARQGQLLRPAARRRGQFPVAAAQRLRPRA